MKNYYYQMYLEAKRGIWITVAWSTLNIIVSVLSWALYAVHGNDGSSWYMPAIVWTLSVILSLILLFLRTKTMFTYLELYYDAR